MVTAEGTCKYNSNRKIRINGKNGVFMPTFNILISKRVESL